MESRNRKHRQRRKHRRESVDGFVSRPSRTRRLQRNSPERAATVDGASEGVLQQFTDRDDGFYARQGTAATDKPVVAETKEDMITSSGIQEVDFDLSMDELSASGISTAFSLDTESSSKKKRKIAFPFRRLMRAASLVMLTLVVGVASLLGYGYIKSRNVFTGDGIGAAALDSDVDPSRLNGEGDGRINVLVIGKGGENHKGGDLTDSLVLASIDPIQNTASLVGVPRDVWVQDENGIASKINAVYSNAKQARLANGNQTEADLREAESNGVNALKGVMTDVLGVPVHYHVMVDFEAFKQIIDSVGGVTIDVEQPLYDASIADENNGSALIADKGLQTFDGQQALLYSRSRKTSARGDFDRSVRQREVFLAMQKKLLSADTFSNPFKVVEIINALGDHVRTDLNGIQEIKRFYEISQSVQSDKIESIGLADPPALLVTTGSVGNQSVVLPVEGLFQYDAIHSYIRNSLRDGFLESEDARVAIMNGTTITGLAAGRTEELESYGYNVIDAVNAPTQNYKETMLIDLSGGENKYTRNYLEKRLDVIATDTAPAGVAELIDAEFVIILGTNEAY